eukprot:gb/GECG01001118.1/.p1 GENE.gb/GECG01001118.1/~~gb/GECG01001118.1/.p1  ORF type:complete len:264 (+),score=46.78 gb/GECG01001118.1/:1-792(+)
MEGGSSLFDFDVPSREDELIQGKNRGLADIEASTEHDTWFTQPHTHLLRATKGNRKSKTKAKRNSGNNANEASLKLLLKAHNEAASKRYLQNKERVSSSAGSTVLEESNTGAPETKNEEAPSTTGAQRKRPRSSEDKENRQQSTVKQNPAQRRRASRPSSSGNVNPSATSKPNAAKKQRTHSDESNRRTSRSSKSAQEQDIEALLRAHNSKFSAKCEYEPRQHSVKDIRLWEKKSGTKFSSLNYTERQNANKEIKTMKASGKL